eukprot:4278-Pelagomonas_calceolata.AAC.4
MEKSKEVRKAAGNREAAGNEGPQSQAQVERANGMDVCKQEMGIQLQRCEEQQHLRQPKRFSLRSAPVLQGPLHGQPSTPLRWQTQPCLGRVGSSSMPSSMPQEGFMGSGALESRHQQQQHTAGEVERSIGEVSRQQVMWSRSSHRQQVN